MHVGTAVMRAVLAAGVAIGVSGCYGAPPVVADAAPRCAIWLYTLPNLQGYVLPVMKDTPEVAPAWHDMAQSAKVIAGTWRLFADANYTGFMGDYRAPADIPQLTPPREVDSLKCIAGEPAPLPRY
jgi:hypothetical protein